MGSGGRDSSLREEGESVSRADRIFGVIVKRTIVN